MIETTTQAERTYITHTLYVKEQTHKQNCRSKQKKNQIHTHLPRMMLNYKSKSTNTFSQLTQKGTLMHKSIPNAVMYV